MNFYKNSEHGGIKGLLLLIVLIGVAVTTIAYTFGYIVPAGYMGVRQVFVGPGQGFKPVGLEPGYYSAIPYRSKIHLLPRDVQIVQIQGGGSKSNFLAITTADGAYIEVQVSLFVRYYNAPSSAGDNIHGGPADLIEKIGLTEDQWKKQTISIAADKLNRSLSGLQASQFYDPNLRQAAMSQAENEMRAALKPYGIEVEAVLLNRYKYVDSKIDEAIFRKNIQSQEEKLNEQASKLSEAKAKLERVAAEQDARIESLRVEGTNKVLVKRSEAELYEKQRRAEGDLKYAKAVAEVDTLKANALASVSGGDIFVAREMAPLLTSIKGGVLQEQDPFDFDAWMKKMGVR